MENPTNVSLFEQYALFCICKICLQVILTINYATMFEKDKSVHIAKYCTDLEYQVALFLEILKLISFIVYSGSITHNSIISYLIIFYVGQSYLVKICNKILA